MTLIFSFLFSSFNSVFINASYVEEEKEYNQVALTDVVYSNNAITIKLKEMKEVVAITYEYAYLNEDNVKVSELGIAKNITTSNNITYTFLNETSEELIGVKIWKVQFKETDLYFPDWMTAGDNEWKADGTTGIDGAIRLKLLEITKNELKFDVSKECFEGLDNIWDFAVNGELCNGAIALYFSFDNEEQNILIDSIYELKASATYYDLVTTYKWPGASSNRVYSVDKINHETIDLHLLSKEKSSITTIDGIVVENMPVIGVSNNPEYDWYAIFEMAEDKSLGMETEFKYFGRTKIIEHKLDEVAIFYVKYIYDGEFYESEVLDFGTGISVYKVVEENKPFWEKVKDWFNNLFSFFSNNITWFVVIVVFIILVIVIAFINGILRFLHLDKNSREIRKLKKAVKKKQKVDEVERLRNQLNNNYISSSKPKNKKVSRYVKNGKH